MVSGRVMMRVLQDCNGVAQQLRSYASPYFFIFLHSDVLWR